MKLLKNMMEKIMTIPRHKLEEKARFTQKYMFDNKNEVRQTARLLSMITTINTGG